MIVSNRLVRVYEREGSFYGCLRRTGRRTRLGPPGSDLDQYFLGRFRLRGDVVAFALGRIERVDRDVPQPFSEQIVVRDLGERRRPVRYEGQDRRGPYVEGKRPGVSDLVVDRRGRVAWIVRNPYGNPTQVEVYKQDSHGRALLDSGDGIDRASLQLRDGQLSWTNGGSTRTAPLN